MTELLVSGLEFAHHRGVTWDPTDLQSILVLESACDMARTYTGQEFTLVEDDEVRLDGTGKDGLMLPQLPIVEVTEIVVEDDDPLDLSEDVYVGTAGILWRAYPCRWPLGHGNIAVTYSHGYAAIPADLRQAIFEIADVLIANGASGGQIIKSETIGSYVIAFDTGSSVNLTAKVVHGLDLYTYPRAR